LYILIATRTAAVDGLIREPKNRSGSSSTRQVSHWRAHSVYQRRQAAATHPRAAATGSDEMSRGGHPLWRVVR
jgi:hypothetical protein